MARLGLQLPDTLHRQLTLRARREGVSLNQYLVFLLAQRLAPAYSVVPVEETAEEQRAAFARLRGQLGSASDEEIQRVLDLREPAPPDPEWTPELRERFERLLAASRQARSRRAPGGRGESSGGA